MQIVIDISEELYDEIKQHSVPLPHLDVLCESVLNGTLLPKGHGRLIDASKLETHETFDGHCFVKIVYKDDIDDELTIIEADSGQERE